MSKSRKHKRPKTPSRAIQSKAARAPGWQWMLIPVLALLLYGNTLNHKYAQDDAIVITENNFTQKGLEGIRDILTKETFVGYFQQQKNLVEGGRYRPLSLVTFALETEIFGPDKPGVSHFFNLALYALCGMVLFFLLFRLFEHPRYKPYQYVIPLLASLLFIAHPVHTEAVANIKGRDEILSLLFCLSALFYLIKYRASKKTGQLLGAGALFFLGLLSKENAYTFVAIIPVTLYFFTNLKVNEIARYGAFFLGIAVIGFFIRFSVLSGLAGTESQELMNDPFLHATTDERLATILFTLGKYLQLLVFPHPLTHDYYPYHIGLMNWGHPLVLLSALAYISMFIYALYGTRKKSLVAYGIWFYLFSLFIVSNIPVSVGVFMSERFLFMPSAGFVIALAFVLANIHSWVVQKRTAREQWKQVGIRAERFLHFFSKKQLAGFVLTLLILVAFSYKTVTRNNAWKDSGTLFLTDVETSSGSAKMNNAAGGFLFEKAMGETDPARRQGHLGNSLKYINRALEVHPSYHAAWVTHGSLHYYLYNDIDQAVASYQKGGGQGVQNLLALGNMEIQNENFDAAIRIFDALIQLQPQNDIAFTKRGLAYARGKNNLSKGMEDFNKALSLNPNNAEALENLGVAHAFKGQHHKAIEYLERAIRLNPDNATLYKNLGMAYRNIGDEQKAQQFLRQGGAN